MLFDDIKLVVYVSKSTRGRWPPGPAFVRGARPMAIRLGVSGALLDDGLGIVHVVEGASRAVDQFMAFVSHYNGLNSTRVVHESRHTTRMFEGIPLGYCFDATWRERISALVRGGPAYRSDVREFCVVLLEQVGGDAHAITV